MLVFFIIIWIYYFVILKLYETRNQYIVESFISLMFVINDDEKKIFWKIFTFWSLIITFSYNINIYIIIIMMFKYFLTCHIFVSSIISIKFFHICSFTFSILLWYSFSFSFQFSLFFSLSILVYRFQSLFISFHNSINSSFYHFLLKRFILFLDMIFSIAFVIISVISLINRFIFLVIASSSWKLSILSRYSSIFFFRAFQFIFVKLYDDLMLLYDVFDYKFSIISIDKWFDSWLSCFIILYLIISCFTQLFSYIRFIIILTLK